MSFPGGASEKEPTCQFRRLAFCPWVGKIPWSRNWQPAPVFLPGKCHGLRRLAGYSPWGRKELDMTEHARARCVLQINILFYGSVLAGGEIRVSSALNTVSDWQFYI